MSRTGRQTIIIPEKVAVTEKDGLVNVAGPLGNLSRHFRNDIMISVKDKQITLKPEKETVFTKALWGTYASHLKNMITGVTAGFSKRLIIEGIGYKANLKNNILELDIGFSHTVTVPIPEGLKVLIDKNLIIVSGFDKEKVGEFTARIRAYKKTEPYKGKGIRYEQEIIHRKQGKRTVA